MKPGLSTPALKLLVDLYENGPMRAAIADPKGKAELLKLGFVDIVREDQDNPWSKLLLALNEKGQDFVDD